MSYELLKRAERELEPLFGGAEVGVICRGFGTKSNRRYFAVFAKKEAVILSQSGETLQMWQFAKVRDTELGREVRKLLSSAAAASRGGEPQSYIARCVRKKRGHWKQRFDAGLAGEVDSMGAGSRELIEKIRRAHDKAHPGCDPSNIEVLGPTIVELGRLDRFLT